MELFTAQDNGQVGRVLRASTQGFAIGCQVRQLSGPSFGCLVKAQPVDARDCVYGLIYNMNVDDDPLVRRLILADNQPETVINDQRQNRLLPIEMHALAVGYRRDRHYYHGLPPRPPLNLDPVLLCLDKTEIIQFTERLGYLRLILRAANLGVPVDQLLVAHLQDVYRLRRFDGDWAMAVIAEVVQLLRNDYETLVPVLEAIAEAMPELGEIRALGGA